MLYENNGDGTFTDVSAASGADLPMDAMGIAQGDYDNDGDLDLYVTNGTEGNALFRNNGNSTFTNLATPLGLRVGKVCWGDNFFDYDNDGFLDLFAVASSPSSQDPTLSNPFFRNNGNGTFTEMTGIGIDDDGASISYGTAIGDYNNDGFYDLAVLNGDGFNSRLYENSGGSNNWIKISLTGTASNRDAIGTWIEVTSGTNTYYRYTDCGISYSSQNTGDVIIGIGTNTAIDSIKISWPSGVEDVYTNPAINQTLNIVEGGSCLSLIDNIQIGNISLTSATLSWAPVAGAEKYRVMLKQNGVPGITAFVTNDTIWDFNTLFPGKNYSTRVRAKCEAGFSEKSNTINFATPVIRTGVLETSTHVFPNPAFETLYFEIHNQKSREISISIYNVSGQLVYSLNEGSEIGVDFSQPVDLSSFSGGVYFYKIQTGEFLETGRFVKE
jgi:hypothetical protein